MQGRGRQGRALARLREAEETLKAIRSGQVDALIVEGPEGEQVFTLQGADFVYRVIVEQMGEGAASLGLDGAILYCNRRLADMLRQPLESTIGASLRDFLDGPQQGLLDQMLRRACEGQPGRAEFTLSARDGRKVPALMSFTCLAGQGVPAVSVIATDLTAEKERADRLAEANQELEAFNYSVSHDLRSPLRAIAGFSQALLRESGGLDAARKEYCYRIVRAAERMSSIIDAMLGLSRTMLAELAMTTVDLSALAGEIVEELRRAEPERRVSFSIAPSLEAYGDRDLLRQALQNIIGNAWKFTGRTADARIEFGAAIRSGRRAFFVRDNGIGFDGAFAEKLFQPFQRIHPREEFPGAGVGLAIAQRIVRRHRGRIWAEGRPGKGAAFYFELPPRQEPT